MDKLNIVKLWVDASYIMHPDYWSHTGIMVYLGWVLVASMSKRKKLNSIISTEEELIRVDNVLP